MATKKREIYARLATQLRSHDRPRIAEEICPGAMGLYAFLLMQARGEQTHGETLDIAAYESWGAPTTYRKKQAAALIEAGLVVREGRKLVVVKYLDHNDGPEDIAAAKEKQNARKDKERHPEKHANDVAPVTRDSGVTGGVTTPSFPYSSSYSLSDSSSESRSEDPDSNRARELRRFDAGTASAERALETFESAASNATGGDFALARAPFHIRDLCLALNKHAPKELTSKPDILRWLEGVIAVWIRACDPPAIEPGKLLTWLNNGRRAPRAKVDTRQPQSGPDPKWLADAKAGRTGTGDF